MMHRFARSSLIPVTMSWISATMVRQFISAIAPARPGESQLDSFNPRRVDRRIHRQLELEERRDERVKDIHPSTPVAVELAA